MNALFFRATLTTASHRLGTDGAEQDFGGGGEVRRAATRPRAAVNITLTGENVVRNHGKLNCNVRTTGRVTPLRTETPRCHKGDASDHMCAGAFPLA